MNTTERTARETTEGEFYNLLWNEMDRVYASTAATQTPTDPQPDDRHLNPVVD